ncbi:hypothetical protein BAY60_20460 [Prauserella muralis]|uniref:Damage-inducible protein DinB n=2 Tax=Prauserella muralis TaxID=588067 RepID=A0A2V4ASB2_9PSEU|nr:hypothetical protein BAY60_20460 [Prauserella muralis]
MLTEEQYLYFTDRALDGMAEVLTGLGDDLANTRPGLPGANSPYAIVTHCLGVAEYWAGHLVAGRTVHRDRDAEFTATGPVEELVRRVAAAKAQLRADVAAADAAAPLRHEPPPAYRDAVPGTTQAGALQHVYEELAQHRGHLELTRDVLVATAARPRP